MEVPRGRLTCKFSVFIEDGTVCIVDLMGDISVTNKSEDVIRAIQEVSEDPLLLINRDIIYRDSTLVWDGLYISGVLNAMDQTLTVDYVGFYSLNKSTIGEGILELKKGRPILRHHIKGIHKVTEKGGLA